MIRRNHHGKAALRTNIDRGADGGLFNMEKRTIGHQRFRCRFDLWLKVVEINRSHRFLDMQGAGLPIESAAIPVKNPIRCVTVLLDFNNHIPCSDGVQATAGNKNTFP